MPTTQAAAAPLHLFSVTLPWNNNDAGEGTYTTSTWAPDDDAAILAVAQEMAEHPDAGCKTDDERDDFIARTADSESGGEAELVATRVITGAHELLAGPTSAMPEDAKRDFEALAAILCKYGARNPYGATG